MMFTLIIFYWSAMDGHSKREVLKIFNMNKKNDVIAPFLFFNRPPICQLYKIVCEIVTWLINTMFILYAKFWFSSIICATTHASHKICLSFCLGQASDRVVSL